MAAALASASLKTGTSCPQNVVNVSSESNQITPEVLKPQQYCRGNIISRKLILIS